MAKLLYELKLDEYKLDSLDHEDLDDRFKAAAKEFEKKRAGNELSDEEITQGDADLVKLFDQVHDIKVEETEETKRMKARNLFLEGKEAAGNTNDPEELAKLREEYKESPEALKLIEDKLSAIADFQAAQVEVDNATSIEDLSNLKEKYTHYPNLVKVIDDKIVVAKGSKQKEDKQTAESEVDNANTPAALTKLKEKYAHYPDLVKTIDKKIEGIKEAASKASKKTRAQTLLAQKEWSYAELRNIGIVPTGEDMIVDGVLLEKQFMFLCYNSKPA